MGKKARGNKAARRRGTAAEADSPAVGRDSNKPKSFILATGGLLSSGDLPASCLVRDLRRVFLPYTAARLRERRSNKLKDFLSVASQYGVTHMVLLSQTKRGNVNLRVARSPQGPTVTFRAKCFGLQEDVIKRTKRYKTGRAMFEQAPLLVLNNFKSASPNGQDHPQHIKLILALFQSMLPVLNLSADAAPLAADGRVLLFHYNPDMRCIDMRHYAIETRNAEVSRGVGKASFFHRTSLTKSWNRQRQAPNLGSLNNIEDLVLKPDFFSESEMSEGGIDPKMLSESEVEGIKTEDDEKEVENQGEKRGDGLGKPPKAVPVPQKITTASGIHKLKLAELGPSVSLELLKIESGFCGGEVIYHARESRTEAEKVALKKRRAEREREKVRRRKEQEENVRRKGEGEKNVKFEDQRDDEGEHSDDSEDEVDLSNEEQVWFQADSGDDEDVDDGDLADAEKDTEKVPGKSKKRRKAQNSTVGRIGKSRKRA